MEEIGTTWDRENVAVAGVYGILGGAKLYHDHCNILLLLIVQLRMFRFFIGSPVTIVKYHCCAFLS